jgi:hypothetical protein
MLSKTILAVVFTALTSFAAASPPACMLGAINTYKTPSDLPAVCKEKDMTSKIAKMCGDNTEAALEAFADTCNGAGVKVSTDIPTTATASGSTATGTLKPSGTGNATTLATTIASATGGSVPTGTAGSGSGSGSPTGTASGGPAQSTGGASSIQVSAVGALVGVFGLVAAAL